MTECKNSSLFWLKSNTFRKKKTNQQFGKLATFPQNCSNKEEEKRRRKKKLNLNMANNSKSYIKP